MSFVKECYFFQKHLEGIYVIMMRIINFKINNRERSKMIGFQTPVDEFFVKRRHDMG